MVSTSRPRLNVFSPLPPARTEIAHNVVGSLPALAEYFDLTMWTDASYWPPHIETWSKVRRWDGRSWAALNSADATLYHIGNNVRFHGWIWDVAQCHPGVIVLHDVRLHAFLNDLVLDGACGAVVHSDEAFASVSARARCPVAQLDLPFDAGRPVVPRAWDGVLRLVVFGYLGANRRVVPLLDAIASFPERQQVRLTIIGQLEDPETVSERIRVHRLGDIVRVRGFVTDRELDDELDRAHLAVNLRSPTMGEASASQLRIWSRGLASVVTRAGWYGQLPPEAVWFVDPAGEVADLHRHFRTAIERPDALERMGDEGRRYLERQHGPARYAAELAQAIDRMVRTPVASLHVLTEAVSRVLTDARMMGGARTAVARRAAGELSRWIGTAPSRGTSPTVPPSPPPDC